MPSRPRPTPAAERPPAEPAAWTADDLRRDPHEAADKADRVRRMFGAIAGRYDLNNRLHSLGQDQRWRRRVVRLCDPSAGERVLDVACGTGDLALALARPGVAEVIGLDVTREMLEEAGTKSDRRPRGGPEPAWVLGDALDLPFEDGRFDVVTIAFGLRNTAEPARAIGEMARVLAPGGRLAVLEFSDPASPLVRWGHHLYVRRIMPWTATLIAGDRSGAYHYLPRSVETFHAPAEIAAMLRDAGLEGVHGIPLTLGACTITVGCRPGG